MGLADGTAWEKEYGCKKKQPSKESNMYSIAKVRFINDNGILSSKDYYYKIDRISASKIDMKLEDELPAFAIVDANNVYKVVTVEELFSNNFENADKSNKATHWIVDTVDDDKYIKRRQSAIRREFVLKQLQERKERLEEVKIYEMLAEQDPDAKKLLEELKTLEE